MGTYWACSIIWTLQNPMLNRAPFHGKSPIASLWQYHQALIQCSRWKKNRLPHRHSDMTMIHITMVRRSFAFTAYFRVRSVSYKQTTISADWHWRLQMSPLAAPNRTKSPQVCWIFCNNSPTRNDLSAPFISVTKTYILRHGCQISRDPSTARWKKCYRWHFQALSSLCERKRSAGVNVPLKASANGGRSVPRRFKSMANCSGPARSNCTRFIIILSLSA